MNRAPLAFLAFGLNDGLLHRNCKRRFNELPDLALIVTAMYDIYLLYILSFVVDMNLISYQRSCK